jgi:protein-S-isoprenylcysteine O-methyltransferase Ste14
MKKSEELRGSSPRHGWIPPKVLLLSILLQVPLVLWSWPLQPAEVPAFAGAALLATGVVMNVWAERLFRKNGVGVCPFSPVPTLITTGPYRFTRNPMYLGMVLSSASVPLITGLYWNLWPAAMLAVWLHVRFILPEEQFLRDRLGVCYLEFASRNSRWMGLPGPRVRRTGVPPQRGHRIPRPSTEQGC